MRTAYLFSAKKGVPSFTYREIELLQKHNVQLTLLVTKYGEGGKSLSPDWDSVVIRKKQIVFGILYFIPKYGLKGIKIAQEAIIDENFRLFLVALGFAYAAGDRRFSSIHVQMADHKLAIGYYLARIWGIPITAKIHAHELYTRRIYDKPDIERKYLLHCNKIITISRFNKSVLVNEIGVPDEKIEVMYLYPSFKKKVPNQVSILIIANWVRKKGYDTLIEAFSRVAKEFLNAVLWIAGGAIDSGSDQDIDVPGIVEKLGLSDRVVVYGSVNSDVIQLLISACDIFCLPSETDYYSDGRVREREGIPVSLMEAMLEGIPVVTTYHAGIPELVDDGLVNERDVDSLTLTIKELINDTARRKELGFKNRNKIEISFNESNVNQLVETLQHFNKSLHPEH